MAKKARVKDIDKGYKEIVRSLKAASGSYTKVGFPEEGLTSSGVASIAAYNEYGTKDIPSRPFMRQSFDQNVNIIQRAQTGEYNSVLARKTTVKSALSRIGAWFVGVIQKRIVNLKSPPNDPNTIRQKNSSNPLVDTGKMRQSVDHVEVIDD